MLRNTVHESSPMLARLVAQLMLSALAGVAHALIFSAPDRCGGQHIVTHARALFGPKPGDSHIKNIPLFAPRAQVDGSYIRRVHSIARKRHSIRRGEKVELGGLWRCIKNARNVAMRFTGIALGEGEDGKLGGGGEENIKGDVLEIDVENVEEKVVLPYGTAIAVLDNIVEEEKAVSNNSMPFLLFNACHPLSVSSDVQAIKGRVAVVARGVCDFAQKVAVMQNAGAIGVVVVNGEGDKRLANMKLNDTKENPGPIQVPAVMISYDDWLEILPCRNDTNVVFTDQGEAAVGDYGRDALNWAMMRGMALWILCQCGVNVVRYKRRVSEFRARADAIASLPVDTYMRPQNHRQEIVGNTEDPVQEDVVSESIPSPNLAGPAPACSVHNHDPERVSLMSSETETTVPPSSSVGPIPSSASTALEDEDDEDDEDPVCAVCLEDFEAGQQVRKLACSHLYHRSCIDPWLQSSSNSCPLCKREVPNLPPPPTQLHYGSMNV